MLTDTGIRLAAPPSDTERRGAAVETLQRVNRGAEAAATPQSTATPGPGWFPDPAKRFLLRWWDGARWTKWGAAQNRLAIRDPQFPD